MASQTHLSLLAATTGSSSLRLALIALIAVGCAHASSSGAVVPAPVGGVPAGAVPAPDDDGASPREHSRVPPAAAGASLAEILAYADQHSPLLQVARSSRSRVRAARAGASARLPANPEVSLAAGPRLGPGGTAVDVSVGLMQEVAVGGERSARMAAAARLGELTEAEIAEARWEVHCAVHAAYDRALLAQARERSRERLLAFQKDVLTVLKRTASLGESARLALHMAEADVAQAEAVLIAARQATLTARLELAALSGWPPGQPPSPAGALGVPADPPSLERLAAIARARLPGLRTAQARLGAAQARVDVADREGAPRPALGVQYQREGSPAGTGANHVVLGVVTLPIPAFQTNQGERARTRSEVTMAAAELAATRRLLEGQVAQARSEVVAAAARCRVYGAQILPRVEERLTLLRRALELGEVDILGLAVAREQFLRVESDALDAFEAYFEATARLERAVGAEIDRTDGATP